MTQTEAEILTPVEAAGMLRLKNFQLYRYVREGVIPAVRVGRQLRFSRSALVDWIERGGTSSK